MGRTGKGEIPAWRGLVGRGGWVKRRREWSEELRGLMGSGGKVRGQASRVTQNDPFNVPTTSVWPCEGMRYTRLTPHLPQYVYQLLVSISTTPVTTFSCLIPPIIVACYKRILSVPLLLTSLRSLPAYLGGPEEFN